MTQADKQRLLNHEAGLAEYRLGDELKKLDRLHEALSNDHGDTVEAMIETVISDAIAQASGDRYISINEAVESVAAIDKGTFYLDWEPVNIGVWVDGSPVYRIAIDWLLKDLDPIDFQDIVDNHEFYISFGTGHFGDPVAMRGVFFDGETYFDCKGEAISAVSPGSGAGATGVAFDITGLLPNTDQSDCTTERCYGYVDYIVRAET